MKYDGAPGIGMTSNLNANLGAKILQGRGPLTWEYNLENIAGAIDKKPYSMFPIKLGMRLTNIHLPHSRSNRESNNNKQN
jgi:hypothetical protein